MTVRIKLDNSNCRPGQMVNPCVVWEFESTPSKLVLELSWQTSGKGTDDSETVFTESFAPDANSGERTFSIALPRGPISVRGNLISIEWQLKCTSNRPSETCVMPIGLSHIDEPVRLRAMPS